MPDYIYGDTCAYLLSLSNQTIEEMIK